MIYIIENIYLPIMSHDWPSSFINYFNINIIFNQLLIKLIKIKKYVYIIK